MGTKETKKLLHDLIEHSDEKLIHILYSTALEYNNQHMQHAETLLKEVERRRQRHIEGESKSYTWEEVKQQVTNMNNNAL